APQQRDPAALDECEPAADRAPGEREGPGDRWPRLPRRAGPRADAVDHLHISVSAGSRTTLTPSFFARTQRASRRAASVTMKLPAPRTASISQSGARLCPYALQGRTGDRKADRKWFGGARGDGLRVPARSPSQTPQPCSV